MKTNKKQDLIDNIDENSIEKLEDGGYQLRISDTFFDKMQKGDNRCEFKLGDRIKKASYEEGDIHQINTPGIIIGSMYIDDEENKLSESYLVIFEGNDSPVFTIKYKLKPY